MCLKSILSYYYPIESTELNVENTIDKEFIRFIRYAIVLIQNPKATQIEKLIKMLCKYSKNEVLFFNFNL